MKLIDLTQTSMGWNHPFQTRATTQIKHIGIHHSATNQGSQSVFENHWRRLGWRNGGYSEIVLRNGDVEICYEPTTVTNGVGHHNLNTYHICVVGNSNFTIEQERSLLKRIQFNRERFQIPSKKVLGHNEFSGHTSNICPGRDMNRLRKSLHATNPTKPSLDAHQVQRGDTLWSIATKSNTTVEELMNLNALSRSTIHPGQLLLLPKRNHDPQIRLGTKIRINSTAKYWTTGQPIPNWVLGQTDTVKQVRKNGRKLLLKNVMSWIHSNDVTVV